jgi:hypothetical protein
MQQGYYLIIELIRRLASKATDDSGNNPVCYFSQNNECYGDERRLQIHIGTNYFRGLLDP